LSGDSRYTITGKMTVAEVLRAYPHLVEVFIRHGMECCTCFGAGTETVERVAQAYGIDPGQLLEELNVAALVGD
jgi:hybrid cluster-associated redox disulfide protein